MDIFVLGLAPLPCDEDAGRVGGSNSGVDDGFTFVIGGAYGAPFLVLSLQHFLSYSVVLLLITWVMASVLPMNKQSIHIAPHSLQNF